VSWFAICELGGRALRASELYLNRAEGRPGPRRTFLAADSLVAASRAPPDRRTGLCWPRPPSGRVGAGVTTDQVGEGLGAEASWPVADEGDSLDSPVGRVVKRDRVWNWKRLHWGGSGITTAEV